MESRDDRDKPASPAASPNDGEAVPCSCDSGCCAPGGEQGSGRRRMLRVRTLIFIAVVGAAIAVAVWSLLRAGGGSASVPTQELQGLALSQTEEMAPATSALPSLAEVAPGKDFAFVLLSGEDAKATAVAAKAVEQASRTLSERGTQVAALTVARSDPLFQKLAGPRASDKLPAVVLLGRSSGAVITAGEITVDELLRGYMRSAWASGCQLGACGADAAKSGCCPGQ